VFLRSVGADFVQGLPCFTACYAVLQPEMLEADTLTVLSSNQYVLIIVCCLRASGYEKVCAGKCLKSQSINRWGQAQGRDEVHC
jgi:hypothetical protein